MREKPEGRVARSPVGVKDQPAGVLPQFALNIRFRDLEPGQPVEHLVGEPVLGACRRNAIARAYWWPPSDSGCRTARVALVSPSISAPRPCWARRVASASAASRLAGAARGEGAPS